MLAQRTFEDLGTPLAAVTFCVVDLETTGGSPATCGITEIGALKVRRGEVTGTFHTLVDPGTPVPAFVRLLTGIDDAMLSDAPGVEAVLPSFLEFAGGAVLVAHNARFDVGFLDAALRRAGYPALANRVVDTAALARKVLAGEVPDHRLATLARHLRCAHQPCHRAFQDVLATTDVLHALIERVAGFGVTTLEDLVAVSAARLDGTFAKISLADDLPRGPGVYRFVDARGATLYVGKAADVRARVRSYFYGDARRRMRDLLREAQGVRAETHATTLEAEVAEARAIARETPPYNRSGKRAPAWYVKVSLRGRGAKVAPTRTPKDDRAVYLGPLPSLRVARALVDCLRDALPLHRCAAPERCRGCAFAELGTCAERGEPLRAAAAALAGDPRPVVAALHERMARLARDERFEEAAEVRDRAALLARTLVRAAEVRALVDAGDVVLALGRRVVLVRAGSVAAALDCAPGDERAACDALLAGTGPAPRAHAHVDAARHREAAIVASWVRREGAGARVLYAQRAWVMPSALAPCAPTRAFRPAPRPGFPAAARG
ncbi:MAG TPA: DEDD exonuclease domain-containing protein [Actinomycetota bacterium]|nr:DEDD exonuclease domain-containing protein [Actinomycetota bacterium]